VTAPPAQPPPGTPGPPAGATPPAAPPTQYAGRGTSGFAIASLVLGIPCFWLFVVPQILAVIFGHLALNRIAASGDTLGGRGLAIAGAVLGWIGTAALMIPALVWLGYGISNL
jgi:hypothetical protein